MKEKMQLEISAWTVVKILLVLLVFYLLYLIQGVLVVLFLVLILVAAFRPIINRWEKKIGRIFAVMILVLMMVAIIAFVFYVIFPPLIGQIQQLLNSVPNFADKFKFLAPYKSTIQASAKSLLDNIGSITGGVYNATISVLSGLGAILLALVMTIYLLLDKNGLKNFIVGLVPADSQELVINISSKMATKIGRWFRGQLTIALTIAVIDFIGLSIIHVPFALTLAVLAGLLDFIPVIGPIIAAIISCLVALTVSPIKVIFVVVLFLIVQQFESALLVPKIMQKAVGLSPVVILLALLIGAHLFGLVGAMLAVPVSALISVLVTEWPSIKQIIQNENA